MWASERLGPEFSPYSKSLRTADGVSLALVRGPHGKMLFLSSPLPGFQGQPQRGGLLCPLSLENAHALAPLFPELRLRRLMDGPSFGFGDRLGLATPGHIRSLRSASVFPVLAQQSMRENARTGRSFSQVLADAIFGAFQEGYQAGFAADADHLKDLDQARQAARLGYTLFTCDPSDFLVPVERLSRREVAGKAQEVPWAELRKLYLGPSFSVPGLGVLRFSEDELLRIAVKYWQALAFTQKMYEALVAELPEGFDFELSVDEAETPTGPSEHLFLALECRRRGIVISSLAPRFSGAMEKALDFRGDLELFRWELRAHVAIARAFGPYKISLHSGSDKFSLYPILAKEAKDLWHVKTAGTSYLVALEVVARVAPALFREIVKLSLERFPEDRASYYLSTNVARIPPIEKKSDAKLPELLVQKDSRQVLHVTFGSVLQSPLGGELRRVLMEHEAAYYEALASHLGNHLEALGVKKHSRL